jgi:FkbM family methyltransferase
MGYRAELLRDYWRVFGAAGLPLAARTRLMADPGLVTLTPPGASHPVSVRLGTSDISTYREVFIQQAYRLDLRTPPRVLVDAGANIGLTSVYFASRYPGARILAIEPEASNAALLTANAAPYPTVTVIRGAVWNENVPIDVTDPGLGKWGFRTRTTGNGHGSQQVQGMTIDALMRAQGVDFIDVLKVDVEGAEREIFADPSAWIDRVGVIVIELHDRFRTGCSRAFYRATSGFDVEWSARDRSVAVARDGLLISAPPSSAAVRGF